MLESGIGLLSDVLNLLNSHPLQSRKSNFANPPESGNRQQCKEIQHFFWFDNDEAIRFAVIACHFGDKFDGSDSHRRNELSCLSNTLFKIGSDHLGRPEARDRTGDIEKGFIQRNRLDQGVTE